MYMLICMYIVCIAIPQSVQCVYSMCVSVLTVSWVHCSLLVAMEVSSDQEREEGDQMGGAWVD